MIITGIAIVPVEVLFSAVPVVAVSTGAARIFNVIPITWGLLVIAAVPFSAANDIEPL